MPEKFDDPVVAEIHAIRAAMLEAAGGDVHLMMQQVAERQRKSKHRVITQPFHARKEQSVPPKSPTSRTANR